MQLDVFEKKFNGIPSQGIWKIVTNGHQDIKTTENEKVYILTKCAYSNSKTI